MRLHLRCPEYESRTRVQPLTARIIFISIRPKTRAGHLPDSVTTHSPIPSSAYLLILTTQLHQSLGQIYHNP